MKQFAEGRRCAAHLGLVQLGLVRLLLFRVTKVEDDVRSDAALDVLGGEDAGRPSDAARRAAHRPLHGLRVAQRVAVKVARGEGADGRVHPVLHLEHVRLPIASLLPLETLQPLKERAGVAELLGAHREHRGGKLLRVTHQDRQTSAVPARDAPTAYFVRADEQPSLQRRCESCMAGRKPGSTILGGAIL
eukprot:3591251-Pleurochrysis_carterae.AAC.3